MQLADYVLQKLKGEQKKTLEEACMRAAQACETIISKGVEKAMNDFFANKFKDKSPRFGDQY